MSESSPQNTSSRKWWLDRRGVIFLYFALASVALLPLCPDHFDWVGITLACSYVVLGLASWLDHVSRGLSRGRRTSRL